MSNELMIFLMFSGMIIGIFSGYRIAFVIGGIAVIISLIVKGPLILNMLGPKVMGVMGNFTLEAVPLFVFMGVILQVSGVSEKLYEAVYIWLGKVRGGLAVTTIGISTLLASASGIIGATETAMGLVALPTMVKKKYNKALASGSILAGGALGIIIPPSIMLVVLGPTTGLSVIDLYLSALMPGILFAVIYTLFILISCYFKPSWGPALSSDERNINYKKLIINTIKYLIPPIVLILLVLGSVVGGIASPTEAAALGATGSLLIALFNRKLNLIILKTALYQTLNITSMVLMIAVGGSIFASIFSSFGGNDIILNIMNSIPGGRWGGLFVIMIILIVAGMLLDWMAIVMIMVPLIMTANKVLGFDPLWMVTLIAINLQISFLSPPFAYAIFYLKGIAPPEITTPDIYRGALMFIPLQLLVVVSVIVFPEIILWLPSIVRS